MKKSALRLLQGGFVGLLLVGAPGYSQQEIQWNVIEEDSSPATVTESSPQWEVVNPEFNGDRRENNASSPTNVVWEPIHPDHPESSVNTAEDKSNQPKTSIIVWEEIEADDMIVIEESVTEPVTPQSVEEAIAIVRRVTEPTAATFANDRALWRNERWYPQISSDVPVGFGPTGVMTTFALNAIDCTTSGVCKGTSDWNNYLDQIERFGEAQYDWTIGAGNSQDLFGLVATASFEETSIPLGSRNTNSNRSLFDNYYIGLHLTRNLGIDTAIRLGVENWIDVKTCGPNCGFPKSAYGVISQRIRLKEKQDSWLSNAYITAGLGNGEFRSVSQKFQASVAAQRSAGCFTYGYYEGDNCTSRERAIANNRSVSYGELAPIGSLAIEIHEGFNLITEWSQGNLGAGFSFRPFKDLGLIFTSMWGSLIQNCDWGCKVSIPDVPGGVALEPNLITERVKWSFNISFSVKL
jgi:hypothetical protein